MVELFTGDVGDYTFWNDGEFSYTHVAGRNQKLYIGWYMQSPSWADSSQLTDINESMLSSNSDGINGPTNTNFCKNEDALINAPDPTIVNLPGGYECDCHPNAKNIGARNNTNEDPDAKIYFNQNLEVPQQLKYACVDINECLLPGNC